MKRRKGFTLIELLVVIAIIALLLSIMMPALSLVKKKAFAVVCISNLNQLSKAWFLYASANNDLVPGGTTGLTLDDGYGSWVCSPQSETGDDLSGGSEIEKKIIGYKRGTLYGYIEVPKLYRCPGDKRYISPPTHSGYTTGKGGYRSYSIVGGLNGVPRTGGWGIVPILKQARISRPSDKLVFLEEADGRGFNINSWVVNPTGDQWIDPFAIWHSRSSSLGFADGHAINHKWVDEDTLEMAENQEFLFTDPDSIDLKYIQEIYPYAAIRN